MKDNCFRKDSVPTETIKRIRDCLVKIGIKVKIVECISYKDKWYSTRLEIDGIPGVGVNGKGITEEYALASAYGELMERLQSGFLLGKYFPNKKTQRESYVFPSVKEAMGLSHKQKQREPASFA